MSFLDDVGTIEKQKRGRLVGSCVCTTTVLNWAMSGEELGSLKMVAELNRTTSGKELDSIFINCN